MTDVVPPAIKATGFQSASDDVERLISEGRITREQVEARLQPKDIAYLGKPLAASSWVPIETYRRVCAILFELEGRGDARVYFSGRGRRAAARLHKAGIYKQFNADRATWGKRVGAMATTVSSVLYNFSRWTYKDGENGQRFEITIDDAREFTDELRWVSGGFIEYMSQNAQGRPVTVTSERVSPDRLVYVIQVAEESSAKSARR